jgi:DNA-binding SARP family transcriptional activator
MFADVVGSTELFSSLAESAADALREEHLAALRAVIGEQGGTVVQGLDDGIMAVFDSAAGAAEAGLAIQRRTGELGATRGALPRVRVGIAAGDASEQQGHWFGTPVVEAARLCASAAGGQVLVSDLVCRLAGSRTSVGFRSLGPRALKGLPGLVTVHEVQAGSNAKAPASGGSTAGQRDAVRPTRLRLLGPFTVEADGEPVPNATLGSKKARVLLKLLVVRRGRHVSMDTIVDALWGDEPPTKAVENVATLVSRLRTVLGSGVIDGGRAGYRLIVPPGCTVDADDASRLVEEAEARLEAGQPALAATAAAQALEVLAAGMPLDAENAAGEWLDDLRREVDRLLRRARVAGWRGRTGVGEHRRALALAEQAVTSDPLDEEAHRAVIVAYHRLGEPGEALAAYERVRTVLVEQLGADPGPETQALHLAVLRGEPVSDDDPDRAPEVRTQLVGREPDLGDLVRCWEEASQGAASCVLVAGESGIGKTTVVDALAREVTSTGATAVAARCYESEQSLFLQPVVDIMRSIVGTLPPAVVSEAAGNFSGVLASLVPEIVHVVGPVEHERETTPEMERRRTFEGVASFLATVSRRRPLLVVLDDLDNAGASTLDLIQFVLRWDRSAPLLFAATLPTDCLGPVESQLDGRVTTLHLGPLSHDAVHHLARDAGHPDLGDELVRLTHGHTAFVVEALAAVSEDDGGRVTIPESLRSAVLTRVARCGPEVDELLRGAVVAGSVFDVEHVADLLGLDGTEAVRRCEAALRAGLLVEAGVAYEFANDVIRDVLYGATPAPSRAMRHRRLAALLHDQPEAAADHAAAGGDWEMAVDRWLDAASRSLAAFANREADGLLTRAFDACAMLSDPSRAARVQLLRGRARLALARYDDASQDLAAVRTLARATGDSALEATALEELAWCEYYARRTERAGTLAERALAHPAAGPGAQILAGRLRDARGDLSGAIETLQPVADDPPDPIAGAAAQSYLGSALAHSDRFTDAIAVLEDAVDSCRLTGLLRPMFNAAFFVAMTRGNLGDLEGALTAATSLTRDAERYGNYAYRPRACNTLSWLWRELGEPSRALDLAHEALESCELPDGYIEAEPAAHARLQLAESTLLLGDQSAAARWLEDMEGAGIASVAFGWRVALRKTELATRLDPGRAEELLTLAADCGSAKYRALALAHLGRRQEAAELAASIGSDLLIAQVAPEPVAEKAAARIAIRLDPEHRSAFLMQGRWRR